MLDMNNDVSSMYVAPTIFTCWLGRLQNEVNTAVRFFFFVILYKQARALMATQLNFFFCQF